MNLPHNWVYTNSSDSYCNCASVLSEQVRWEENLRKESVSFLPCLSVNNTLDYVDLNELTRNWSEANARYAWQKKNMWQMYQGLGLSHTLQSTNSPSTQSQSRFCLLWELTQTRGMSESTAQPKSPVYDYAWIYGYRANPVPRMDKVQVCQEEQLSGSAPRCRWGCGQCWYSTVISQPDSEELCSPVTRVNKELTFKPNYINTAVSY